MAQAPISARHTFYDTLGKPLANGKVYTVIAGTNYPAGAKTTFTNQAGTILASNPILLDAAGQAEIWLGSGQHDFIVKDANDTLVQTIKNVAGAADSTLVGFSAVYDSLSQSINSLQIQANQIAAMLVPATSTTLGLVFAPGGPGQIAVTAAGAIYPVGSTPPGTAPGPAPSPSPAPSPTPAPSAPAIITGADDLPPTVGGTGAPAGQVSITVCTFDRPTPAAWSATLTLNADNTATVGVDYNEIITLRFLDSAGATISYLSARVGDTFTGPINCKKFNYEVNVPITADGGDLHLQLINVSGGLSQASTQSHTHIKIEQAANTAKSKLWVNFHDYEQAPNGNNANAVICAQKMKAAGVVGVRMFRDSIWGIDNAQDNAALAFMQEFKTNYPQGKIMMCISWDVTVYPNLGTNTADQAACAAAAFNTSGKRSYKYMIDKYGALIDYLEMPNEIQLQGAQDPNSPKSNNGAVAMARVCNILIPQIIEYAKSKNLTYGYYPASTIENGTVPISQAVEFAKALYTNASAQVKEAYLGPNFHLYDYDDRDGTQFYTKMNQLMDGVYASAWPISKPCIFGETGPTTASVAPSGHSMLFTPDQQRDLTIAQLNLVRSDSRCRAICFYVFHNKGSAKPNDGNSENNYGWLYGDLTDKPVSSGLTMLNALAAIA